MSYKYCQAENWGKNFIKKEDALNFSIRGLPGNIWKIPNNNISANQWIINIGGVVKTKEEAQTIVNNVITESQNAWDSNTLEGETTELKNSRLGARPVLITNINEV